MELRAEANIEREKHKQSTPVPVEINELLLTFMLLSGKSIVAVSTSIMGSGPSDLEEGQADKNECFVLHIPFHGTC